MSQCSKFHHDLSSKKSSIGVRSSSSKLKSKYESIEPKINSGYHVGKLLEDFEQIQKNFRFKPDEIFPRIKISFLVSLIAESGFLKSKTTPIKSPDTEEKSFHNNPPYPLQEMRENLVSQEDISMNPYLLLDVRDFEQFESNHIITAESYPRATLSRANYETSLLLKYRNHKDYIIIVYDENETAAPQVATTLIQRGYNNVFMLSGGLRIAKQCFPHSLVVHQEVMTPEISRILVSQLQQMSFRYKK